MSQEPFGDIPLFREIQRLLASGSGPVNFEIARQVGMAIATQGSQDPDQKQETVRAYGEATHVSEALLSGYTRLGVTEPIRARTVGRAWWVGSTLKSWGWLFERLASRFTQEMSSRPEAGEGPDPTQAALGQVAPLLLGVQAGTLVGHLATETLVRFDLPIPRDDDDSPFFVIANIERVAGEYDFDEGDFRSWLAVHEASRHLVVGAVPWIARYHRALVTEVVDAIEIDASEMQRRLTELQSMGVEGLEGGFGESTLPVTPTERHRRALERLRAFLALFEGYATSAANAVLPQVMTGVIRIDEGMARRKLSPSDGEEMLAGVLGVSLDRALETAGLTFCAAVGEIEGLPALNRVWQAPDNLPTQAEIKDPFAWMERVPRG